MAIKKAASQTPSVDSDLDINEFRELGDYAEAGMEAVRLALERANRSLADGRIPISGAAVERASNGQLQVVTVGHNGRIPPLLGQSFGYPTDHGETAAIREIVNVSTVEWSRVVFATTLSPCIMCGSALKWLWKLGLRRIVVAESSSFAGTASMLEQLDGMIVVRLSLLRAQSMMKTFSLRHPWDWAADIGEIPPGDLSLSQSLETASALGQFSAKICNEMNPGHQAAVVSAQGIVASAKDERLQSAGNETRSAVMIAIGSAGSHTNLRECVLFFKASGDRCDLSLEEFGPVSIGACKLFRPAKVVVTAPPALELKSSLEDSDIPVLVAKVENP
eukprot:Skav209477  [mRNA]  locus=scaffold1892:44106:46753:+ [translate_table: standard]